jgi:alpha-glucosidase (family GH31 glycosyl hydrolase)
MASTVSDVRLTTAATRVRVQCLAPNAVRVTHAPLEGDDFPPDRPWLSYVLLPQPGVAPDDARLVVDVEAGQVRVRTRDGQVVAAEASPPRLNVRRAVRSMTVDIPATEIRAGVDRTEEAVALALAIQPGEGFYGWGEWFDAFRREQGKVKLRIRDAHAMIQGRETYSAIPLFYSSRGYGFWLLNSHESTWTIDPARGVLEVEAAGPGADYVVIHGPAMRDILMTYTALTGRPPLVPRWALGLMVTGYPQEPQAVMLERVTEHRRRSIPLDGLILDYHWEERFHNFRWRRSLFPDPDRLIADLKAQGVRLGLIFTPFVNHRNRPRQRALLQRLAGNLAAGTEKDDETALPEYQEALAKGYLAHADTKWWFGAGGMIDFSLPAAADWWNARMRPLYEQGVAFFKNDDGEYLPASGRSALGMNGREYHNLYGFFYGRAIYDGMRALDDRRPFIYARSAWAGSQRYPALFLGDQKPTYDHIRSTLRAGLSLGLLGFAHWTADVFGLDGKTTPELHRRYAQYALLVPIARYFWRPPAVDGTRFPWSHSAANEANFKKYAALRYRLLPYYSQLGWEAYLTGLPVLRPMVLDDKSPDDARLAGVYDQALLGDRLLLAPIVSPEDPAAGQPRRRVLLPAGGPWHDFWTTDTHPGGGEIDYPAPPDRLPLLVRGGSILPMGPSLEYIPEGHRFDTLELHCWPPYPAEIVFHDDDGATRAYQRGAYSTTRIRAVGDPAEGRVTVTVSAAEGGFPEQAAERQVQVFLQRAPRPEGATANGRPAEWRYDEAQQAVVVSAVCSTERATRITVTFAAA